jgi:geranylgeranyl diphosphate synthase type 3
LDEGKISLPLIFCLAGNSQEQVMIKGILQHKATGELSKELKLLILEQMKKQGALEQTYALLQCTQDGILRELKSLECQFGAENSVLELVLRRLWI